MAPVAWKVSRRRLAVWIGVGALALTLVVLARARPGWPWFSLWLLGLLGTLAVVSAPPVRRALGLSWFRVTLITLSGVALFNLFLFHVETHRQRSERLEIEGVWFDANQDHIRVGVGEPDVDVRLEGSLYDFDRWSLDLRPIGGDRFAVENVHQVDMLRVRSTRRGWALRPGTTPALGQALEADVAVLDPDAAAGDSLWLDVPRTQGNALLRWGPGTAPLSLDDPILERRLASRIRSGIPVAELEWDTLPDRALAEDLVLTRIRQERSLGRLRLMLPRYRLVSRSRGVVGFARTGAFERRRHPLDHVAGQTVGRGGGARGGRVACCGAHRGVVRGTPALGGMGAALGRGLRARRRPVRHDLDAGAPAAAGPFRPRWLRSRYHPLFGARAAGDRSRRGPPRGRSRVRRVRLWRGPSVPGPLRRRRRSAGGSAAPCASCRAGPAECGRPDGGGPVGAPSRRAPGGVGRRTPMAIQDVDVGPRDSRLGLLNVFLVFLGLRLALGLRVAYTPPFYDRAATTAVGLWITFALLVVVLARWPAWSPRFWRLIRRLERPMSRLFLPGIGGEEASEPSTHFTLAGADAGGADDPERDRRARGRTVAGLGLVVPALAALLWQRPDAAASLLVAAAALTGWLAMGVARRRGGHWPLNAYPLRVLTADAEATKPSVTFALAAGASMVLVLAMHAPLLALGPVLGLLLLFGVDGAARLTPWWRPPGRRGWLLFGVVGAFVLAGVYLFVGPAREAAAGVGVVLLGLAGWLHRPVLAGGSTRIDGLHRAFDDLRVAVLSGVGWVGVLLVLGALVFLNTQEIPPFVRFALVFTLFLLAIRAGLACNRVLRQGTRRGRIEALALLVIPVGVLLVFMLFDFGLGLVFFVPMFITVLLSARIDRLPASLMVGAGAVVAIIGLVAGSVLRPSLDPLQRAADVTAFDAEFKTVGNPLVDALRTAGLSGPITRATVRSVAASNPALLEDALAFAGPSEALLAAAPSLEQVWGGRAYAASGWTGTGFAGTLLLGRGIPTAVSYAENTFSVYVLSEHGALGGLAVLLAYLALLGVVGLWIVRVYGTIQDTPLGLAVLALTVGGVLWLTLPAAYVAASNLAVVPLTGQNMPFLGLNSWADVVLVCGLATGILSGLASLDDTETMEARS